MDRESDFVAGTRVIVRNPYRYRNEQLYGLIGTVATNSGTNVSVILDTVKNPRSSYGRYYFKPHDLEIINETNKNMEENIDMSNAPNITNYYNAVKIQYLDNTAPSSYLYANFITDLKVGNMCVIKSAHHGFGLAIVVEVIDRNDFEIPSREVVTIVDTRDYDERMATRKKATELLTTMQERAKKLQDIALYQMLAENDPEMAELLKEYKGLTLV